MLFLMIDSKAIHMRTRTSKTSLSKELFREQLPFFAILFALGLFFAYSQAGYLPGGDQPFAVAGVRVPIWHLLWMGLWTGYIMGLVGEASGLFAMPYSMSILHFTGIAISPTTLIVTFLNPFGALLGYWRSGQHNWELAKWVCLGALVGSPIGPFIRVFWLADPEPFKMVIGVALVFLSLYLTLQVTPWFLKRAVSQRQFKEKFDEHRRECIARGEPPKGLPDDFCIETLEKSWKRLRIGFWGMEQTLSVPGLFITGALIGVGASAMGVGGGFMLVPIMVTVFGLPMYVLVAATVPFVITLSVTGLLSYVFTVPMLTGQSASPDWGFGLIVAAGAMIGAWIASKTQQFIPEKYLKPMLGLVTGLVGLLYVINYFYPLPFEV